MRLLSKLKLGRHWTEEEVCKLCNYVSENGPGNWKLVAACIGTGRTANSCRQRWFEFHQSGIRKGEFIDEEMLSILMLHSKWGGNSWSKISKDLPGRTSNQIKNFWNKTFKKEAMEFPRIMIKRLVEKIEGPGKSVESCLHPTAYNELIRLYTEPPPPASGGTTAASSSTTTVDHPDGFELMPSEIPQMSWNNEFSNFSGAPEIPRAAMIQPQQNELLGVYYGGVQVTGDMGAVGMGSTSSDTGLPCYYPEFDVVLPNHFPFLVSSRS